MQSGGEGQEEAWRPKYGRAPRLGQPRGPREKWGSRVGRRFCVTSWGREAGKWPSGQMTWKAKGVGRGSSKTEGGYCLAD